MTVETVVTVVTIVTVVTVETIVCVFAVVFVYIYVTSMNSYNSCLQHEVTAKHPLRVGLIMCFVDSLDVHTSTLMQVHQYGA